MSPRTRSLALILVMGAILIVSFQNFSSIPLENLKPQFQKAGAARKSPDGGFDIREVAPRRPASLDEPQLALPQGGQDLESVGRDWAGRQAEIITGGAEKRLLASVNRRIDKWMKFEPVEGEPWPEPGDEGGATSPGSDSGDGGLPGIPGLPSVPGTEDMFGLRPTSLRMASVNKFEVGLADKTQISCSIESGNVKVDLSRPLTDRLDFDVRHESGQQSNSVHLRYDW